MNFIKEYIVQTGQQFHQYFSLFQSERTILINNVGHILIPFRFFFFSEIISKKLQFVTMKRPYSPLLNSLSYNSSVFNTPYKFWIKSFKKIPSPLNRGLRFRRSSYVIARWMHFSNGIRISNEWLSTAEKCFKVWPIDLERQLWLSAKDTKISCQIVLDRRWPEQTEKSFV